MARIALISCNTTIDPYPVYPLGMTMVAEAGRARGHDVTEWDMYAQGSELHHVQSYLESSEPDYIGLSLRNVDSANYNKQDAYVDNYKDIVVSIRQVSGAPIILGGSAYTLFPDLMLEELQADFGVAGEGETAFYSLIDLFEHDPLTAPRITYNNPVLSGNEFSALNRNAFLAEFYLKHGGMLSVQTKRGCPHRCAYCSYPILEGHRYRFRQPEDVVDEIETLVEQHRVNYYAITDSVFNDAAGHYLEVAEELIRRNINVPWMCFLRPDDFQQEEVDMLKKSGLNAIEWGTDCVTDETLQAMHKDFSWEQVVHSNNIFARAGVANAHFIIFGGPKENLDTIRNGLANLQALERCVIFAGIGVRIFPDTAVYHWAVEEGVISEDQNLLRPTYYFSQDIEVDYLHTAVMESFQHRLDRVYPDGQYIETTSAYHSMGNRGPAWDMLLRSNIRR